jgi:hypothetical protein
MAKKTSKAQANKEVRRILTRYQVDLAFINFSAGNNSLYFGGYLMKTGGANFKASIVNVMTQELLELGRIRCELENWYIGSDGVHFTGKEEKKHAA